MNMLDLSPLESRIYSKIPSQFHGDIAREFDRFEVETSRISKQEDKIGQATLTDGEIRRLNTTNQHGNDGLTVVQYQAIKAKAFKNGVSDWTSKVDSTLSYHENMKLMEQHKEEYR